MCVFVFFFLLQVKHEMRKMQNLEMERPFRSHRIVWRGQLVAQSLWIVILRNQNILFLRRSEFYCDR